MYIRRTKIISTIGPDSNTLELIEQLISEGVDYFRLNCSHGTLEWHRSNILKIRQLAIKTQKTIGIIIDLQGPKIRIGDIEGGWVELHRGDRFTLTVEPVLGTKERISTSYLHLPFDVKVGDQLFIDDGFINVSVEAIDTHKKELECKVLEGGILKSRKGINLPQAHISTPSLTEDDMPYLQLALDEEVDYIALSFVRFGKDVVDLKKIISDQKKSTLVIAKIECREALDHIDEIIDAADAVLVARGDLGVEIPPESVPLVQKELIFQCNMKGKPVITATQMLESMIKSPRPTRAEISDVANAILDGTDAVMVSSETAIGKYPVEVIQFLRRVAQDIEQRHPNIYRDLHARKLESIHDLGELITHTASIVARNLKAKAIVTYVSDKGLFTVLRKLRSVVPIIALTSQESVLKQVNLIWGVCAVKVANALDWSDDAKLVQVLGKVCDLQVGDSVLLLLSSKEDAQYFDALRVLEVE